MYEFFVTVVYQVFIFRRLKINHESHEFILDSGTVVNKSFGTFWTKFISAMNQISLLIF
jgi:hypothetical protein